MNKVVGSADEAIRDMQDGAVIMSGGFGLCANPENLIEAIHRKGVKNLTVISNNCGTTEKGLGVLLKSRQIRKMIASYVGENKEFERQFLSKELEVELNPQGTLAERIRAGGAGLGGFFTPTGAGTMVAEGKETRVIDGRPHVFETPLRADLSVVRAQVVDRFGNARFHRTARNFSPLMATAAEVTVLEADQLVEMGAIDPDDVHLPGLFVDRIVHVPVHRNVIESRTTRPRSPR